MKRRVMHLALASACLLMATLTVWASDARLMRHADVHGDRIVFTYEDDLWLVSADGGDAGRITRHPGVERYAKFSPDGQWIAFTGGYDGGSDVYLIPSGGGVPTRLTFHPSRDRVMGWMPGGKEIYFRSSREMAQRGERVYTVSIEGGGMPKALPVDRAGLSAVSPDGQSIAYNRISREDRTWKRYRGGMAQNIWLGSMKEMDYRPVTDWTGTDNYPMWGADGRIYFTSDREDGTLNIYQYDLAGGQITRLTMYDDYDVKYPSIGPGAIVYQYGEALHLFDLENGTAARVPVGIPSDRVPLRPEYLSLEDNFGSFGLSPSGARLLLEARGELVNLPTEENGLPVNLTATSASREKNGAWSPDGKWIAFLSDRSGEEEIYLVQQGGGEWRQVSDGGIGFRMQPVWSPDSRHLVFSDKFMRLNLLEVESGSLTVIDQGHFDDAWERWGIQDYTWSPDSRWIAYTRMGGNMHENIWLYDQDTGAKHQVTGPMTTDWSPSFDPGGEYLYFLSNRTFAPVMGQVDQNHIYIDMARPYMVLLRNDLRSPFAPEAFLEEEPEEEEKSGEEDGEPEPVVIHTDDFPGRTVAAEGVPAGNYFRLEALEDGFLFLAKTENEFIKYQNVNDLTGGALELRHYVTEDREAKTLLSGIRNYHLSADREKMVYRYGNRFGVVDTGKEARTDDGRVDLSTIRLRVDRGEEFLQIFNEAWRIQRDWFYDPGMHGVDWEATGEKYRVLVPWCGNRGDLNYLIGEMIGELNIGHTYIFGGDFGQGPPTVSVGLLGVDFAEPSDKGFHRIEKIIPGTPWHPSERSPLDEPGCPVSEGDYIIAVNGRPVTDTDNIYGFFEDTAGKPVRLTWNSSPTSEGAEMWLVTPLRSERQIRYRQWVETRRRQVEKASGGAIGYLHLPDMSQRGLIEFARAFYPQVDKQALVIDERYNGGGFVGDMIIDRLERRLWSYTVPREGGPGRNPERVGSDKLAVLINEDTGSNGEFFAEALKRKDLATIIGMRTWGGVVGIEPHQGFVDGGGTTPPQFGLLGTDRTWIVEGRGVEPDMEVQNQPGDVMRGKDAQLEAAIQLLLEKIAGDPAGLPDIPTYPVKNKVTE